MLLFIYEVEVDNNDRWCNDVLMCGTDKQIYQFIKTATKQQNMAKQRENDACNVTIDQEEKKMNDEIIVWYP